MDRPGKHAFVASLAAVFAETSMIVVTRSAGLNAAEVMELRKRMRASGSTYKVTKNRLTDIALNGTQFEALKPLLKGPTALAWSQDPVAVAKAAVDYAKANDKFVLVGGALGRTTLDVAGVRALAELPSLDVLRAGLIGMISTPATRIAGIMAAPAGQLARVLAAYARTGDAPADPPANDEQPAADAA